MFDDNDAIKRRIEAEYLPDDASDAGKEADYVGTDLASTCTY